MLEEILSMEVYKFLIIFCRMSVIFMFMPLFSTAFIFGKFRLCLALAISAVIYPSVYYMIPAMPASVIQLLVIILYELLIGAFLSVFVHIIFTALEIAGAQITFSVGFSHSMVFDPFQGQQTMLLNSFLFITAYAFLFVTDLHHLLLNAVFESYTLFIPGKDIVIEDMTKFLIHTLDTSFKIGLEISFPFVVLTFAMQTSMAVIAKLMPQLNILFLAMPAQIYFGMNLLAIMIGTFIIYFVKYFENTVSNFITG